MRILIVEDEEMAARMLRKTLVEILGGKVESIQVQRSLIGSQCHIQDHPIDVLFLDLNLNGEDGFALLRDAVSGSFHTIVVSAHTGRAIEAFEYGVLDFVAKPYSKERIQKAIERYREGLSDSRLKYLSIAHEGRISLIPIESVNYIEAFDKQTKIYCTSGSMEICNKMLQNLEKILPPDYVRVHRSFIANLREIEELQMKPNRRFCIALKNGDTLPVSRSGYQLLKEKIEYGAVH